MGKSYWFGCEKCGYRAKVAGRADEGLHLSVQTILCRDCKELFDAVTRIRILNGSHVALHGVLSGAAKHGEVKRPPSFDWALNRLRFEGERISDWLKFPLQCPVSPAHRVREWNNPDRCPRCAVYLERSALAFRIWE
jgi:hypothetical protein